jgi:hypothetical protein
MVTDGRISLRASAYLELHVWLAALAKHAGGSGGVGGAGGPEEETAKLEPEIAAAVPAYERSLANDDDGVIFDRAARRLAECANDACALQATEPEGFGRTYARALPVFTSKYWFDSASDAWVGIEASHAALTGGPASEALLSLTMKDLGIASKGAVRDPNSDTDSEQSRAIDFVSRTPPTPHDALFSFPISARGSCFRRPKTSKNADEDSRIASANLLGCIITRLLVLDPTVKKNAPAHAILVKELGDRDGERAFNLLLVHASAVIVTNWEPRHVSVDRMSARAVEEKTLHWLAQEWRGTKTEAADVFAQRYAAAWKTLHTPSSE